MASKSRNMFQKNKTQETTENDQISFALEKNEYCGGVFLDVAQAFDRVWHPGLLFKLKRILPSTYYLILQSYLTNRYSVVCHGEKLSGYIQIKASVPQGSVLGPLLYLVYTADILTQTSTSMATFADDICNKRSELGRLDRVGDISRRAGGNSGPVWSRLIANLEGYRARDDWYQIPSDWILRPNPQPIPTNSTILLPL
ncbi:hypothetical protein AAG570_001124 [Ranatra chinensis]|uniref:Reverse transcriptase domain-containing protein n=1 Tax=Ranatra chinensis TaxID=642074 RepID=A0ABD0YTJ2_9HEMI